MTSAVQSNIISQDINHPNSPLMWKEQAGTEYTSQRKQATLLPFGYVWYGRK